MERVPVLLNLELEGLIVDCALLIGVREKGGYSESKAQKIEKIKTVLRNRYPSVVATSHGARYVHITGPLFYNDYPIATIDELRIVGIGVLALSEQDELRIAEEIELDPV